MVDSRTWTRLFALTLVPLLLVPQAFAATSTPGGSTSTYPGQFYGLCQVSVTGLITGTQSGGVQVQIEMPYIPTLGCLADTGAYQIPAIPVPALTVTTSSYCFTILTFNICIPLPDVITTIENALTWFEDSIANGLIQGFNEVYGAISSTVISVVNAIISTVNAVILIIDSVPLGLGGILLGAVLSIGEPWSAFLTPLVWFVVIALIAAMLIAVILVAGLIYKAVKSGAEVAEVAA